ncbi:MAG: hypothetical protein NTW04_03455 [Elusimicrobia bacterium]|nr:hypothetical protein [Elusimicrobiota bacterium]
MSVRPSVRPAVWLLTCLALFALPLVSSAAVFDIPQIPLYPSEAEKFDYSFINHNKEFEPYIYKFPINGKIIDVPIVLVDNVTILPQSELYDDHKEIFEENCPDRIDMRMVPYCEFPVILDPKKGILSVGKSITTRTREYPERWINRIYTTALETKKDGKRLEVALVSFYGPEMKELNSILYEIILTDIEGYEPVGVCPSTKRYINEKYPGVMEKLNASVIANYNEIRKKEGGMSSDQAEMQGLNLADKLADAITYKWPGLIKIFKILSSKLGSTIYTSIAFGNNMPMGYINGTSTLGKNEKQGKFTKPLIYKYNDNPPKFAETLRNLDEKEIEPVLVYLGKDGYVVVALSNKPIEL